MINNIGNGTAGSPDSRQNSNQKKGNQHIPDRPDSLNRKPKHFFPGLSLPKSISEKQNKAGCHRQHNRRSCKHAGQKTDPKDPQQKIFHRLFSPVVFMLPVSPVYPQTRLPRNPPEPAD